MPGAAARAGAGAAGGQRDGCRCRRVFEGSSLLPVACCLRLLYRPREAHSGSFAVLTKAGLLEGVADVALRLQAHRLLRAIKAFLQGMATRLAAEHASVPELAAALAVA
ncbi:hypothetical protein ABPG75_000336 [Micractinium tetrahymenae]